MEVDKIDLSSNLSKDELMKAIRKDIDNLPMTEIMKATKFIKADAEFLPKKERDLYIKRTNESFILRLKKIQADNNKYRGDVDTEKLKDYLKVAENLIENPYDENSLAFQKIAKLVVLYASFIKMESIHIIGTKFPGNVKLIHNIQGYMCPAKEKQLRNPNSLCKFCVSKQNDNNF